MDTLVKFLALTGSSRDNMKKKEKDQVGEDIWSRKGLLHCLDLCSLALEHTAPHLLGRKHVNRAG